jgi:hypothetical protein
MQYLHSASYDNVNWNTCGKSEGGGIVGKNSMEREDIATRRGKGEFVRKFKICTYRPCQASFRLEIRRQNAQNRTKRGITVRKSNKEIIGKWEKQTKERESAMPHEAPQYSPACSSSIHKAHRY